MSLFSEVTGGLVNTRSSFLNIGSNEEVVDMPVFDHGVWLPQHDDPVMYSFFTREPGSFELYKQANVDAKGLTMPRRMATDLIRIFAVSDFPERSIKVASLVDRFQFLIMDKVYFEADLKLSPFIMLPSLVQGTKIICCDLDIDHWLPIPPQCRIKAELYFKSGVTASELAGVEFVCFLKGPVFRPVC